MTPFLQLAFTLAVILFAAKLGGYLTTLIGQPSVLGELIVGLLLGPSLLDIIHLPFITDPHLLDETITQLGELGVLLLMFLAGLELHFEDLARNTKVSALAGILGVIIPVGLGWTAGSLFGFDTNHSVFLGLTLGATSVSISAQTLIELKMLRSRVGLGLLGAAVFDDILVILLLSTFIGLVDGGSGITAVGLVILRMTLFLALSAGFGLWLLPRLVRRVANLSVSMGVVTFAIVVLLTYGLAAELIGGMAAITGTFLAGLMFSRTKERSQIEEGLHSLSYAFFVPIFFISIGLSVNVRSLTLSTLWILLVISILAILGKIIGAGGGARIGGFSWRESIQIGVGMISRGEVGLIVASVGLTENFLDNTIFSAIVGMVLVTTLVTPPMLRASFDKRSSQPKKAARLEPEPIEEQEAS